MANSPPKTRKPALGTNGQATGQRGRCDYLQPNAYARHIGRWQQDARRTGAEVECPVSVSGGLATTRGAGPSWACWPTNGVTHGTRGAAGPPRQTVLAAAWRRSGLWRTDRLSEVSPCPELIRPAHGRCASGIDSISATPRCTITDSDRARCQPTGPNTSTPGPAHSTPRGATSTGSGTAPKCVLARCVASPTGIGARYGLSVSVSGSNCSSP